MLRVLHAELLKLKRTLAFRVVFVLPLLVALLQFFALWRVRKIGADFKLWETLPTNMLSIWAVFMMPLLITLETALLNGIEHGDRLWKHLLALPVRATRSTSPSSSWRKRSSPRARSSSAR
jgi:hypothetical protein